MNICSEHDGEEIAYSGRYCPACTHVADKQREIDRLESTISSLERDNDNLQSEVNSLEDEIHNIQENG